MLCSLDFNNKVQIPIHRVGRREGHLKKKRCPWVGNLIDCYVKSPAIPPPTPTWGGWGITLIAALLHSTTALLGSTSLYLTLDLLHSIMSLLGST